MTEDLFFNKLVTKSMQAISGDERFFEGYLTVEIKDKQGEITVVDELYKVLPIWMDRGAPISDTHSNRIIGKGINYSKDTYKDKDGEEYPAIKITGKIHKDYELDNEIWKKIKSGEYKGLSFGGATKSDRDPVRMKDGSIAYSLKDLEHYEVAVCADPAVPLALITDYNPLAKSATNAEVRDDGKMVIKCDKFGCYITKGKFDDDKESWIKDAHPDAAEDIKRLQRDRPDMEFRVGKKPCANCKQVGGLVEARVPKHEDPKSRDWFSLAGTDHFDRSKEVCPSCDRKQTRGRLMEHGKDKFQEENKADNITKPIPDGKGGKGDFDHCEEKNQDKNDPAAFCGAIQHKLEKAIEAGMLQQVAKNGLEIFLTKEELNKVCSACGKTLEEHGIVKYDHSNSMGDQHSMYNQNSGRETWVGQGLPQPVVEGKDDHPAEQGLTINGDAMQHSDKKKVKKTLESIVDKDNKKTQRSGAKPSGNPITDKLIADYDKPTTAWRPSLYEDEDEPAPTERTTDLESEAVNRPFDDPKKIPRERVGEDPFIEEGKEDFRPSALGRSLQDRQYTNPYAGSEVNVPTKEQKRGVTPAMATISREDARAEKSLESIFKREGANQAWGFKKDKLEPVLGNVQSNKGEDAEANPEMSPQEWLQWYKKRPKKKAEESNFGAGQRGLGYGNEGHTIVQGSGQSHTITEIPPEMEVIVHDVKDIKESKKEGYTTEAGNSKRGDPSRATDDDDSLLSQTFAKKDYKNTYIPLL